MITIKLEHGDANFAAARLRYIETASAVLDPGSWVDNANDYDLGFHSSPVLGNQYRDDEFAFWQLDQANNWWGSCYHDNSGWLFKFHCRFWEREAVVAQWMAHVLRGTLVEESPA